MNCFETFAYWKNSAVFDAAIRSELEGLDIEQDREEIVDRFSHDLSFGTGGLRGIMGAGTNRINRYTIGKATMGLGKYVLDKFGSEGTSRGVVIAYDTRKNSMTFARVTANVLSAMGIKALLFEQAVPTPQLSFCVRYQHAIAGVVITASHNPKEYNGYKVYDEYGCQLTPDLAEQVAGYIKTVTEYGDIPFVGTPARIEQINVTEEFVSAVLRQSRFHDSQVKSDLRVVYTPLHGTGYTSVCQTLLKDGFVHVSPVLCQVKPDGAFPTVVSPNPEDSHALILGIAQAQDEGADLVLGTDPDCDRVGVAIRTEEGYRLLTGNQIGALLMDFILIHSDLSKYRRPAVVKTIVTSELGAQIARAKGIFVFSTLTGFKYIGEKITQFERAHSQGDEVRAYDFLFGYEESCGYLVGTHARDKDAVSACMLICEMAAALKQKRKTLMDRLNELYMQYGYYLDSLDSFILAGPKGLQQIVAVMEALRQNKAPFENAQTTDYVLPVPAESGFGDLPAANVIQYQMSDGSWVAIRPSGTEPKIKVYYCVRAEDAQTAAKRLNAMKEIIRSCFEKQGVCE